MRCTLKLDTGGPQTKDGTRTKKKKAAVRKEPTQT